MTSAGSAPEIMPYDVEPTPEWRELMAAMDAWMRSVQVGQEADLSDGEVVDLMARFASAVVHDQGDMNCDGEMDVPDHPIDIVLFPHRVQTSTPRLTLKCPYCGRINKIG